MFDECAGNFTHKRLKAVLWLLAVVVFFVVVRAVAVRMENEKWKMENGQNDAPGSSLTEKAETGETGK